MKLISSSKRNGLLAKMCIFLITTALTVGMVGCDGDGSQNLEIRTWYDLDAVRDNLDGNHILMNDLDSTTAGYDELAGPTANGGKGWEPIGIYYSEESHWCFTGTFDGQGYEVRDLFVNYPDGDNWVCAGLFTDIEQDAVIKDIGVVNATVAGLSVAGGLVGVNDGTVSNCYFTGSVTGMWRVGGLVGDNYGTVSNSYAAGIVAGEADAGGLVGANSGTVSDSYSTGSVTGNEYVGGLVGRNWSDVSNSYYNYDEVLINGENVITIGALFDEDFEEWLANDKFLDVNGRLCQEDGYYAVNNVTDFKQLLIFGQDSALKFRLKNDLDLTAEPNFYVPYLAGEFDGNGHRISNLSFDFDFISYVGLFGYVDSGGTVHEAVAESVNITACRDVGGLVGFNMGAVGNSSSSGSVTGNYNVGGLVGHIWEGNVSNSHFTGSVNCSMQYAGGLVGQSWEGNVSSSYSTGSVNGVEYIGGLMGYDYYTSVSNSYFTGSVTGKYHVGGLVGDNNMDSTISNSYSTANVTGDSGVGGLVASNWDAGTVSSSYSSGNVTGKGNVGGLVAHNHGTVSNSYATGTVAGAGDSVGGLMGSNGGPVSNCYATGSVIGDEYVGGLVGWNGDNSDVSSSYSTGSVTGNSSVGGLVGGNAHTVSNSYSTSNVTGYEDVGGLVGRNRDDDSIVSSSYSTGTVSGDNNVGGLVGLNEGGTVNNSFWDVQTSGQATSDGGTGKNTTEMWDIATFSGAGWKITAVALNETDPAYIWNIVNNVTYPFLSWHAI